MEEISKKWRSAANEKPEMSRYLPKNTKMGDFNTQRTLSGSFFVIPERLASIRAVVLAFTANKQTNKHSQLYRVERGNLGYNFTVLHLTSHRSNPRRLRYAVFTKNYEETVLFTIMKELALLGYGTVNAALPNGFV